MKNAVVIVRVQTDAENTAGVQKLVDRLKKAETELKINNKSQAFSYYILNQLDCAKFSGKFEKGEQGYCAFIFHTKTKKKIQKLIWTVAEYKSKGPDKEYLSCQAILTTEDSIIINNFINCLEFDIPKAYEESKFVTCEISPALVKQMNELSGKVYEHEYPETSYDDLTTDKLLHRLAQRNGHCRRYYHLDKDDEGRAEFQRDHDKIVYSRAFRRMVDKAQIFTSSKGDHYRTRMTHTMVVKQIARSISVSLGLNQPLTEAIALGHDLGHTPFGHQGERTLNAILSGDPTYRIPAMQAKRYNEDDAFNWIDYGGFKHNYQSVRVAAVLEESYLEFDGLNLSYQVLEGMLKHTKLKPEIALKEFVEDNQYNEIAKHLHLDQPMCSTLEGQVVAIADEIAQRSHDIDDAFSAGLLSVDELQGYLSLDKFNDLYEKIKEICTQSEELEEKGIYRKRTKKSGDCTNVTEYQSNTEEFGNIRRLFVDRIDLLHTRISATIVSHFINDAIAQSKIAMKEYFSTHTAELMQGNNCINDIVIKFSEDGQALCSYLEKIISRKVINSPEVALFDDKASKIVYELFCAYYNNPALLHDGPKRRIFIEFRKSGFQDVLDHREADPFTIRNEWKKITTKILKENSNDEDNNLYIKRKILVRAICDFIAGMTDSYAENEYRRIFKLG